MSLRRGDRFGGSPPRDRGRGRVPSEGPAKEKRGGMKKSKRVRELIGKVGSLGPQEIDDAIALAKESATAKFDETVEVAFRLGIDPKRSDQQLRGTIVLPHGTGRTVRILVLAKGEKVKEAEEAGADHVGAEEYIEKIKAGWLDFDTAIATPDMMKDVGKLGKILGPRGLMPNPKTGTVTFDIGKAVGDAKAARSSTEPTRPRMSTRALGRRLSTPTSFARTSSNSFGRSFARSPRPLRGSTSRA